MKNEIIIFDNQEIKLEVNLQDETVWLNTEQMAKLFDRDYKTIRKHINNALKEELDDKSTIANFAIVQKEGRREVTRNIEHYNLDVIISVGYRVKSKNGVAFRKWANQVLKDYLIKGYAVNNKRLEYLEKTVQLIGIAGRIDKLKNNDAKEIIKVINAYSQAFNLLDNYDHKNIIKPNGTTSNLKVTYVDCMDIINKLKFNNESTIFAIEKDKGLESIIGAIYQTYDEKDLYTTTEEKSANLLYLVIKNHPFIDGNKRIAAALFIYFLEIYNILYKDNKKVIDNNTLVSITLLIAESNPKEKEILIDLVMNFLN